MPKAGQSVRWTVRCPCPGAGCGSGRSALCGFGGKPLATRNEACFLAGPASEPRGRGPRGAAGCGASRVLLLSSLLSSDLREPGLQPGKGLTPEGRRSSREAWGRGRLLPVGKDHPRNPTGAGSGGGHPSCGEGLRFVPHVVQNPSRTETWAPERHFQTGIRELCSHSLGFKTQELKKKKKKGKEKVSVILTTCLRAAHVLRNDKLGVCLLSRP